MNAFTRHDVRHRNPSRKDSHPYFARLRFWNVLLNQLKDVRSTVAGDNNSLVLHALLPNACAAARLAAQSSPPAPLQPCKVRSKWNDLFDLGQRVIPPNTCACRPPVRYLTRFVGKGQAKTSHRPSC